METFDLTVLLVTSAVSCAVTGAAGRWWYQRKLTAAAQRFEKIDKARQFSAQQTLQARKQIEKLQKDLATFQRASADAEKARAREKMLHEVLTAAVPPASTNIPEVRQTVSVNGFADTLPM